MPDDTFVLDRFPEEQRIIGRMVLEYGMLETSLLLLVHLALRLTEDDTARLLFRVRSESDRINLADAILRPFFQKLGLAGPYSRYLGAMRHCKTIRNQYAHAVWWTENELAFASLDEPARSTDGPAQITFFRLALPLLREQEAFFRQTYDVGHYMVKETDYRLDRRKRHKARLPKASPLPKLRIPVDLQSDQAP